MRKFGILALILLSLASCTQIQPTTTPTASSNLKSEVEVLKARLDATQSRLSALESRVSRIEDKVASNEQQIFDLKKREEKVEKTLSTITVSQEKPSETPKKGEGEKLPEVVSMSDKDIYREAFNAMDAGDLEKAKTLFEELVKQYPQSSLADNALYWIGEIYYSHNDYETAAKYFQEVMDKYPGANKVPDAMLKLALCYKGLGQYDKAVELLQRVMDEYQGTPEAAIARVKLLEVQKLMEMENKTGEVNGTESN